MKLPIITLLIFVLSLFTTVAQDKQTSENPFDKLGYDPLVATSSRGDYEEFHDKGNVVEIGSVLFNTKTNEVIKILKDGETTIDLSSATAAMSIDPHCERYYWISPYAYAANNPLKFIDPDGRDIKIYYTDENKKQKTWVFNGTNHKDAPDNTFVNQFLQAYDYLAANDGGESLISLATNNEVTVGLKHHKTDVFNSSYAYTDTKTGERGVRWDPNMGLKNSDGHTLSPANVLEHEMGHNAEYIYNNSTYSTNMDIEDSQYGEMEERRNTLGPELKSGIATGEYPAGYSGRKNHGGSYVPVGYPTSNGTGIRSQQIKPFINSIKRLFKK